ncbi:hypothetical protein ONS95_008298 [Cadophora gregata]|uniref:uncharacterized protein n=2 Tax=Cadophora gregata TaxID=51156 RepID=UPI0026DD84FA|nr:uncharacterized protein ONS95_008298 [Cadophora gregata]KAK0126716.1 hypothetical protein ONS95_008298 [Cadophora gregata]
MTDRRKRKRSGQAIGDQKRQKISQNSLPVVKDALLTKYYPQVLSLREYLLSKLPVSSRVRRRKILSLGRKEDSNKTEQELTRCLDQTLVGVSRFKEVSQDDRWKQWTTFSQKPDDSVSFANTSGVGTYSQSEIVDFAIWLLFSKSSNGKVQHLLCQGFRKDVMHRNIHQGGNAGSSIPGVTSTYPNSHVTEMKARPWPQILLLMGKEGERAMIDLILDCGIYLAVESGHGTFNQLSGIPLADLPLLPKTGVIPLKSKKAVTLRSPSSINFVRNRMLYAKAALNAKREVSFGLRHIHVLNRYPLPKRATEDKSRHPHTIQVMMYIFPRQFGLHNVFTSDVDPKQTVQPFKDYTLREDEIKAKFHAKEPKIPKRLRGKGADLVRKLQIRHNRCAYKLLLEHYCPILETPFRLPDVESTAGSSSKFKTQMSVMSEADPTGKTPDLAAMPSKKPTMMSHATPAAQVSAFCRAVLSHLIPSEFWGSGESARENEKVFHQNINKFIELRRFETMSLHQATQGLKITDIAWLAPGIKGKTSQSDISKRWEIFHEFLYYIFDSVLIPLIRSNFHVTESNIHRYRLFYFRHDVWRTLADPALASLKVTMFEEIKLEKAQKLLESRELGFSQVRLLPKETGVRPIMNLRRRALKKVHHSTMLGRSINSVLAPVYNILSLEKTTNPSLLGSTLFSVGDLYHKLGSFKASLPKAHSPLYFAKLDVRSAFDTIPQSAILKLIRAFPSESSYRISKYTTLKPGDNHISDTTAKPIRKWTSLAHFPDDFDTFSESLSSGLAEGKKNTVFTSNVVSRFYDRDEILNLLDEHIKRNMVKIGKKFYRQKEGIPQGSVLSSLLCNYFYADLEATHLDFLDSNESLLLRLIDDFLLITTNRSHAKRFLEVMHEGLPEYGVTVNPDKTLVNFEAAVRGRKVPRLLGDGGFPYCGSFVDTKTLDVRRDRERRKDMAVQDSLTVEFSRVPGKAFGKKVLSKSTFSFKFHSFNSCPPIYCSGIVIPFFRPRAHIRTMSSQKFRAQSAEHQHSLHSWRPIHRPCQLNPTSILLLRSNSLRKIDICIKRKLFLPHTTID